MRYGKMKNKGAAIIMVAGITLGFLLVFAVLAIDFSRMYYVRGELQNAADSGALAGADLLTGDKDETSDSFKQEAARQAAWKFACKSRAAKAPVYISTNSETDCDSLSPPPFTLLNGSNNANGDIVVGHWRTDNSVTCTAPEGWETMSRGYFCRSTGSTGLQINAVKIVARRTGETPGMPEVDLLFPNLVGLGTMGVKRQAVATLLPIPLIPLPICIDSCSLTTPLKTEYGYDISAVPSALRNQIDPEKCSDLHLDTIDDAALSSSHPGQEFFLNSSNELPFPLRQPGTAWTNFSTGDCAVSSACDNPTPGDVMPYIKGETLAPDVCNKRICTNNGDLVPLLKALEDEFNKPGKGDAVHTIGGVNITGWLVTLPVVESNSCGTGQTCPGAPTAGPYRVLRYTKAILTEFDLSGDKGIRIVGLNNPSQRSFTFQCYDQNTGSLVTKTTSRLVSGIDCVDCGNGLFLSTHAQLVK